MRTNIEEQAWSDDRIVRLASALKMEDWAAVGAMTKIWRHCQKNKIDTLDEHTIAHLIRRKGFLAAAIEAELLKEVTSANEKLANRPKKKFYICGMRKRLQELEAFYKKKSDAGKLGNESRWGEYRTCDTFATDVRSQNIASMSMSLDPPDPLTNSYELLKGGDLTRARSTPPQ